MSIWALVVLVPAGVAAYNYYKLRRKDRVAPEAETASADVQR
ncbi:hypothetical protein [Kribbella swartbergensis]